MRQSILFWASCWSVFAFLFLPFTYYFIPNVGVGLSQLVLPINREICSWFGVEIQNTYLVSDSLAFYSTALLLLLFSGMISLLIYWKFKKHLPEIQKTLLGMMILLLAYFLIRYGLDKIFHRQFYTPAANTLHTPTGQLGKDILFWTSMGTSSFYNATMAIAEVLTGILLLINRTRFLGLLLAFGILGNIFAINVGFDITVKYLSGLLLITSAICLMFYKERLKSLITGKSSKKEIPIFSTVWILILFTPFFVDLVMTYWENLKNESGNSYQVQATSGKSKIIDSEEIVRIHFHPAGYFITENKEQKFTSYKMSANRKSVIVKQQFIPISIVEKQLVWKEGESEIRWELEEIDLEMMPLKQDEMNWYFEGIGGF
jgi:hypothetical protein